MRTEDDMKRFVSQVLADTEDVWTKVFAGFGRRYPEPQMVLFSGATRTACGTGVAQMGPFYCPLDRKVYIDLSFYDMMKRRSMRRAISRRPTSSRTRSAITSRSCWASPTRCRS